MKHRFLKHLHIFFFASAVVLSGCKEDTIIKTTTTGTEGIDVMTIDTMTIITQSVYVDTLNTSKTYSNLPTIHALGAVSDPYFGSTYAGIYMQVLPTANSFNFSSGAYNIDSAFIILPYTGFKWGDSTVANIQSYEAYEVNAAFSKDKTYYSNTVTSFNTTPISKPYTTDVSKLKLTDSVWVSGVNTPMHLRIPLNDDFIAKIKAAAGGSNFDTKESFLNWLKGIYIAAKSSTGATLPYFYLDGSSDYSRASIAFYYTETAAPSTLKKAFFNFSRDECAHYNYITRTYNSTVNSALNSYSPTRTTSDTALYLQNEPGATIDIRVPYIKNLPQGIINKAQLTITKLSTGDPNELKYSSPVRIDPYRVNADLSTTAIADLANDDYSFVGGTSSSVDLGGGINVTQYKINMPREVQRAIIEQWNELHLRVRGAPLFPAAYSLRAGGKAHSKYSFNFQIIYTTPK